MIRFGLCCIFRDVRIPDPTPAHWETYFNQWIAQYVLADQNAGIHAKARRPLSQAHIKVTELPARQNTLAAVFFFHPHFQLEDPPVGYRVIAALPQTSGLGV